MRGDDVRRVSRKAWRQSRPRRIGALSLAEADIGTPEHYRSPSVGGAVGFRLFALSQRSASEIPDSSVASAPAISAGLARY